ncbi:transposase domain-containing protein [Streptomyces sp. NPDC015242]|uniref:transposase domain-containing protein n=1 Tax=Streptomyces sp. NPDC015242 TaxID=3364951 RepID=UPI0036FD4FBD
MRIGILTKVFTAELVDAAIAKHDRAERRRRLLSARLVVYFVLALCLFARESYEEVLRVLTSGIPGSRTLARVNRSSLCRARVRLGENVLETVFRQVAGPLATPATPGAWWRGLRLLALDGTQFDLPDSTSNGDTFDGPSTTGGVPFGSPRSGRWCWPRSSDHLGTAREELPDGSYLSMARPGKEVRLRAAKEGRKLPRHVIYRVITFAKDDKVAHLGTTLLNPEQYPADELVALYRERWEIEPAFDEIKNHLGPGGPIRSRTPEGVRQELWAYCAVHQAIRQVAHTAALARPTVDADRVSHLKCVRIIRRSILSQLGSTATKLTHSFTEAGREARARLRPARRNSDCPRAIKKPNRWPVLRTRARRGTVQPGRWAHNPTSKPKSTRRAGRPALSA